MNKFILHGGYTSDLNPSNDSFFKTIADSTPPNGNVLLVFFASKDDVPEKFNKIRRQIKKYLGDSDALFILADAQYFEQQLAEADVVYIHGGDTQDLMQELQKVTGVREVLRSKVVAGSSAGAYVLAAYYFSNSKGAVSQGLGCLPIRLACHFESLKHESQNGNFVVSSLNNFPNNLELILLKDYEWRVVNF